MNGYTKIKIISDTESRSMDLPSDLSSLSSSPPETRNPKSETPETDLQEKQIKNNPITDVTATNNNNRNNKAQDLFSFSDQEEEGEGGGGGEEEEQVCKINYNNGKKFGGHVKLSRNSTVSSSSAASHALQSTVMRAFSMRRSCSVSERYSRIHDQSMTVASPIEDGDLAVKKKKKKKRSSKSKIIKACKKLFGL